MILCRTLILTRGQSRKSARLNDMSVLSSTAEVVGPPRHVRFVPITDILPPKRVWRHRLTPRTVSCRLDFNAMVQERPIRVERRLSAILAADVAGYSRLMHSDEEPTHAKLTALMVDAVTPQSPNTAAA